jgi:hypothetical protein
MILLQVVMDSAAKGAAAVTAPAVQQPLNILELISKGGYIMVPIGLLSIIGYLS